MLRVLYYGLLLMCMLWCILKRNAGAIQSTADRLTQCGKQNETRPLTSGN